jgi:hypothetical protein
VSTTHLHPLLGLAHRLQVASYRRRVDEIICQQLNSTTTTRGGSRHWRRADRLRVLDLWRKDDNLQSLFWRHVIAFSFGHRGGLFAGHLHRLGGSSGSSLGLCCQAFNGHRLGNSASLGFGTC